MGKDAFAPANESADGNQTHNWDAYKILQTATFQVVAHSMDAMIYRFLYMFKRLRALEDVESSQKSTVNSAVDLDKIEVPSEEVNVILNYLCKVIKDTSRVREGVCSGFEDGQLDEEQLAGLRVRLTYSLDALELAAVNELSSLVSKCFGIVLAPNREILIELKNEKISNSIPERFDNW
eukprot:CAMPEP_0114337112 /NCGR_PEP_ID=MMETSP0101-20121206/6154_1 /TAXON_ID=38822 ORGANISM="Pteridomonas danica, Strain PT" /NCGR_SAMPLE_ID=MMETSP0101 /ASSEMBLY_ACC=CAM_ASM_000211 /LENGTH=178 /DNA_ID=CAMNT_0001469255 /DNA_START=174 /DNA_END=707 /DNA_ORIENTATION=-